MAPDPMRMNDQEIREAVRERYASSAIAVLTEVNGTGCCSPKDTDPITRDLYDIEASALSDTALVASLGCGNPTALAELKAGDTVLDLGSGGGLDVLLSAKRVGPTGKAYGLDMTAEMLELARRNQAEAGVTNAEFIEGTIEHVPLPDGSVDVIISNCVINLAADKDVVLREAHRVLRAGGRVAVSDMVLLRPLPAPAMQAMGLWTGCISGALLIDDYKEKLTAAGFHDVDIEVTRTLRATDLRGMANGLPADVIPVEQHDSLIAEMDGAIVSAFVRAVA